MSEEKKHRNWWLRAILGGALALLIPVAVLISCRRTWIRPLAGVRVEMTRRAVQESHLGPESAYRLLLQAIEEPTRTAPPVGNPRVWSVDGMEALAKLRLHGWPAAPPLRVAIQKPNQGTDTPGSTPPEPVADPASPWSREQYEDIRELLTLYGPNVALLDRALAAPNPQMPTIDGTSGPQRDWWAVLTLARWLAISAEYRAATGDCAGAFRDLGRAVDMGNLLCRGGGAMNQQVAAACQTIAMDSAWHIAAQRRVPLPVLREAARHTLRAADTAEPAVEALRADALSVPGQVARTGRTGIAFLFPMHGFTMSPRVRMLQGFLFAALPLAGSTKRATERNLKCLYQHGISLAQTPYSAKTKAAYESLAPRPTNAREVRNTMLWTRDPVGYLWAAILVYNFEKIHHLNTQRDATLRGTALFLALKAHEAEHGTVPERLEQLVPEYLPRIPSDPFDGRPFRYLKGSVPGLPPTAWGIYSVGSDFTDDGGTAQPVGAVGAGARDRVWASQPYPTGKHQ